MNTIFKLLAVVLVAVAGTGTAVAAPQANDSVIYLAAASQYPNQGKVLEVIETSMYTYIQVSSDNGPVWLAASATKLSKGAMIGYPNGAVMTNFHSKSLNRTFDRIIFLDKVEVLKK